MFQTGAYGGLWPEEHLHGSGRVAGFLAEQGSARRSFEAPEATEDAPEAEWGLDPALAASVEQWAAGHGHPVHRITLAEPHGLSDAVADLHQDWLVAAGEPAGRLLVESFVMLDPAGVSEAGLVPYWTAFPVQPALAAVRAYLRDRDFDQVDVLTFPHGVRSAGIAEPGDWLGLRDVARNVRLPATDVARYPADFRSLAEAWSCGVQCASRSSSRRSTHSGSAGHACAAAQQGTWTAEHGGCPWTNRAGSTTCTQSDARS